MTQLSKSLSRKFAAIAFTASAGALTLTGAGSAHASGDLYGAIAYRLAASNVYTFSAVNQSSQEAADELALAICNEGKGATETCKVQVRFVNACGSLAERSVSFAGGTGATRQEAEGAALTAANNAPTIQDLTGSSSGRVSARILLTACNRNAG
ncbi:DUF4189 domain-containing protein [Nocardia huaxiensis]|uniref:DUF4189 domain-containing protein n=1 Tax=Nocardia huaxiensis TaxID=2755382 RepID=A0A7D6ZPD9_9NOCA|nr:DUF4189 domain-containing protein [Nocardia huaxiensis]QLY30365.1 DUF4189 domain-containing protein [Nocardia huaxiensis]UFS95998.1 DUF4189 domain-containing protein [Nocardia huaxiensis]